MPSALELRALVQSHELEDSVRLVVALLYGDAPSVASHWVAGPEVRQVLMLALGKVLRELPECKVTKVAPFSRVTVPFCFM